MFEQVTYEQVILWAGLALLLVLCLPLAGIQKLVLEISAWAIRLSLLVLLGAAAYLGFRPEQVPPAVAETVSASPLLRDILPAPGTPAFGAGAAALVVLVLLPLLAVLDTSRKLAGRRLRRLRALTARPAVEVPPAPAPGPQPRGVPALRRPDRRAAADAVVTAGSRPYHAADRDAQ